MIFMCTRAIQALHSAHPSSRFGLILVFLNLIARASLCSTPTTTLPGTPDSSSTLLKFRPDATDVVLSPNQNAAARLSLNGSPFNRSKQNRNAAAAAGTTEIRFNPNLLHQTVKIPSKPLPSETPELEPVEDLDFTHTLLCFTSLEEDSLADKQSDEEEEEEEEEEKERVEQGIG
ncbi:hypothetical protein GQ457_01G024620 [Hibiscus cannabinus]